MGSGEIKKSPYIKYIDAICDIAKLFMLLNEATE